MYKFTVLFCLFISLSGCGYKGDLYLPKEQPKDKSTSYLNHSSTNKYFT
ncbi:LPS translocon maturation chaperone LptM [Neisseria sp. Ec49-e6-T10]